MAVRLAAVRSSLGAVRLLCRAHRTPEVWLEALKHHPSLYSRLSEEDHPLAAEWLNTEAAQS